MAQNRNKTKDTEQEERQHRSAAGIFFGIFGKLLLFVLVTAVLLVGVAYGAVYVFCKGPSETARDKFVMSMRETSAMKWLPGLVLSDEEISEIESAKNTQIAYVETDTSLVTINTDKEAADDGTPATDEWGLTDDDGDGIIVEAVHGSGYSGYMMVVLDPSRVILGSNPNNYGYAGYSVAGYVEMYDGVAAINAGGFEDPNGNGNGSEPNSMVVYEGQVYYANKGCQDGFVGLDYDHILHVGNYTAEDAKADNIEYGVSFGPVLVQNGVAVSDAELSSGVNPRTAIGQRADGAILLLVIDGRQVISLGATYADLAKIMLSYGAVNACNLDGGSSTLMWWQGGYINSSSSLVGVRNVPTSFVVLKEGDD